MIVVWLLLCSQYYSTNAYTDLAIGHITAKKPNEGLYIHLTW